MSIPEQQEPKYDADHGGIFNRQSQEYIPHDEPVMIFRARDIHAMRAIEFYASHCTDQHHRDVVFARADQFKAFAEQHPERMKEPDTDKSINLTATA